MLSITYFPSLKPAQFTWFQSLLQCFRFSRPAVSTQSWNMCLSQHFLVCIRSGPTQLLCSGTASQIKQMTTVNPALAFICTKCSLGHMLLNRAGERTKKLCWVCAWQGLCSDGEEASGLCLVCFGRRGRAVGTTPVTSFAKTPFNSLQGYNEL